MKTIKYYSLIIISLLLLNFSSSAQQINGTVRANGNLVDNGFVIMYHTGPLATVWPVHDTALIASNGDFKFNDVPNGDWLLMAVSDTANYIPTYGQGNTHRWDSAQYIRIMNDIKTIDIDLIPRGSVSWTGQGSCSGTISYQANKTEGDPIPEVDIILEQVPGSEPKARSMTGVNGLYGIDKIPDGSHYKVFLRIPGLEMEATYEVKVTSSEREFENLDLCVDTASGSGIIFLCPPDGIEPRKVPQSQLLLHPNPASYLLGLTFIDRYNENGNFYVRIIDASGRLVTDYKGQSLQRIDVSHLATGIYTVQLSVGETSLTEPLIISR